LVVVPLKTRRSSCTCRPNQSSIGKGNQDLRDIPQSVTVVTEKLIEDRNQILHKRDQPEFHEDVDWRELYALD